MLASRSIQGIIVLIFAMFVAIWLGVALVTNQFETILQIGGAGLLIASALLGRRIWLLFILMTSANVVLYRWFGTTEIGQFMFMGFSLILFMMRKLYFRATFTELHFWALMVILCIVQVYMRHPIGLNIFGSGNVGGRPYVVIGLCIVSSGILSFLLVPPKELKWAVWAAVAGGFIGIPLQMARYGSFTSSDIEDASRVPSASTAASVLIRWLNAYISPLRACFHPFWVFVLLLSVGFAASSGYRNAVANIGFMIIVGILYRSGFTAFLGSMVVGGFALAFLALINLNFPLPANLQRALAPLPGTWEEKYRKQGTESTEWRIEMWKEALFTDRWIQNKLLGDGIGISAAQLEQNMNLDAAQVGMMGSGLSRQQENMLIVGSYHSGPVHSVRMVGYVGLIILLVAMIRLAVHAHRQIMRCRGTEWHGVALFFGIPQITHPFFFTFVFGEYHTGVAQLLLGMAIIVLIERNLPLPAYQLRRRRDHVPLSLQNRMREPQNSHSV